MIAERGGPPPESVKVELTDRFAKAIDAAAMRDGSTSTDAYLEDWRRGEPAECGDDLDAEAKAAADAAGGPVRCGASSRLDRVGWQSLRRLAPTY